MANLLDQASIVLTPTAYDDGKVLCAKPSEPPYGDFDFSRNSAATRVNAQGLVENVQILSSNLVQNGDFSEEGVQEISNGSFSQEGVEEITNGSFDTDSNWTKGTGWSISGGSANCDGTQSVNTFLKQQGGILGANIDFVVGKTYKVNFDIIVTSGQISNVEVASGYDSNAITTSGNHTTYITAVSTNDRFTITANPDFTGSIDNVSVREVGQDWTLNTGWSIGEDKAIATSTANSISIYQNNTVEVGKTYKVTYTVADYVEGGIYVRVGSGVNGVVRFGNGTYTEYITQAGDNKLYLTTYTTTTLSITNISVKEVGQNWDLNGEVTIGDNLAHFESNTNTYSYIRQDISSLTSKTYKIQLEVKNYVSGAVQVAFSGASPITQNLNVSTDGVYTAYLTPNANGDVFEVSREFNGGNFNFEITNISVIEITDDTNLPRINYEGFSYQDALGSELITNGDFATDSDWNKQSGWIITNGYAESTALGTRSIFQNTGAIVIGKTYQVTYTILETNGSIFRINFGGVNGIGRYTVGTYTENIVATSTSGAIYLDALNVMIGKIDNVSVKEYLGQEVVPDSGCGSWLFEPQSTNLITQSELFSDASWVKINSSVASGFASPSGNTNAYKLIASVSNTDHRTRTAPIATAAVGTTVTFSIYIKPQEITKIALVDNWTNLSYGVVNLTTNSVIEEAQGTTSVTEILNGFRRVSFTYQTANINTLPAVYLLDDAYTSGNPTSYTFASDGTSGVYIWGAQLEQQSYATSYIPTNGEPNGVTRNQDLCTNGGSLASINSTEGVLYAEIAALSDDGTTRRLAISDGSNANRVLIGYNTPTNSIQFVIQSGGSTSVNQTFTLTDATQFSKVAFKYKENDCSFWIDGVKVGIDITALMPIGLNQAIFAQGDIARPFFSKTKALAVWKEALSDEELTLLTAPAPVAPTFTLDFDEIANQFTFNRASLGTIVNEQGLIETVSNIGPELVTNGSFDTDSDWSKNSGWTISGGNANSDGISSNSSLYQNVGGVNNTIYKITGTISNYVSGTLQVGGSSNFLAVNSNGDFVHYRQWTSDSTLYLKSVNFIGSIDNVSVKEYTEDNIPRIDYSTGTEAFLLEPQSTNLVPYSEDFSQWTPVGTPTITSNYGISPDGTQNSTRVQFDADERIASILSASGDITFSVYLKGSGVLTLRDNTNVYRQDVTLTSEWARYDLSFNATITSVQIQNQTASVVDCEVWGAQAENLTYSTSYIPTSGTTVTRVGETCVDATPEINSEEGVLYAEIARSEEQNLYRLLGIDDGTSNNYVKMGFENSRGAFWIRAVINGVTSISSDNALTSNPNEFYKIAIRYQSGNSAIYINGTSVLTTTTTFSSGNFTALDFNHFNNSLNFYGNTKDLQYFNEALNDYQLAQLTTI